MDREEQFKSKYVTIHQESVFTKSIYSYIACILKQNK